MKVLKRVERKSKRNITNSTLKRIQYNSLYDFDEEVHELRCEECDGTGIPYSFRYYQVGQPVCQACIGIGAIEYIVEPSLNS